MILADIIATFLFTVELSGQFYSINHEYTF